MKKQLAAAAALLIGGALASTAQTQVVKDAERALKDGKSPAEVVAIITPAFSNPETAEMAQTYFIPGKSMFENYDKLYGLKQFNKLPENGAMDMANDLMNGYDYYTKALSLDSVADAKGKIKTKYSKEIISTLGGHATDYNEAALTFWEVKNYMGAYKAWDIFLTLCRTPKYAQKMAGVPADTVLGEIAFNQALAAWQADSLALAMQSFSTAKSLGYNKKTLYDYSLAVANGLNDEQAMYTIATEAQAIYGSEDPSYIGYIINHYLQSKEFDKAFAMINEAIAGNPNNAQYYVVKGILYDNQEKKAEAKASFKKAIELDGQNWQALLHYGRTLCDEAYSLSDAAPTSPAESEAFYKEKIVPLFKEAAEYLEQSWNINNENPEALRYLENVYYNLHDETMMKDVESRKLQ